MRNERQTAEENRDLQTLTDSVDGELYEELLNRYERVLVYAGQLQEKLRQHKLLEERNSSLEKEVERLKRLAALEESYARLLEKALGSLGVLPGGSDLPGSDEEDRDDAAEP